ncbi:MAG: hypothetical protein HYR60_09715 [Acidobacteria bacterium]|nr:hypothetical protein [Acidobacteriota bacterium]
MGQPMLVSAVNAASQAQTACSPGAVVTLLGTGLSAGQPQQATALQAPLVMDGVQVQINGEPAPVLATSSTRVNSQCPVVDRGTALQIVVRNATGISNALDSTSDYAAPGIFTLDSSGTGQGMIALADTGELAMLSSALVASRPAQPGDSVMILSTGLGALDTAVPAGAAAPFDVLVRVQSAVQVYFADQPGEITFAGLVPGMIGMYQVVAVIPPDAQAGDDIQVRLEITAPDGRPLESNRVTMAIEAPLL